MRFGHCSKMLRFLTSSALFSLMFLGGCCWFGSLAVGEDSLPEGAKLLTPESFGFEMPVGQPRYADNQSVAVMNESGERVIGRLHCWVGDQHAIVLMPDGQLRGFDRRDAQLVDEPFRPARHIDIARSLTTGPLEQFRTRTTRNYVYVYNTSDRFADVTSRILESMHQGITRQLRREGFEVDSPPVPLVVIMFGSAEQFREYRPMRAGVIAYYDMVKNHIVLYEPTPGPGDRVDLIRGQALSNIAHEGAHQILHNIGIQQRLSLWPMWLSEGLAEYYAPTSFGNRFRWKGAGEINDLRMFQLENYLQISELRGLDGSTIRDAVGAARLDATGYATAWSIVHYLAEKRRDQLFELVRYLSRLKPLYGMAAHGDSIPENLEHFSRFFEVDPIEAEVELLAHLREQRYESPVAGMPHIVVTAVYQQDSEPVRRGCIYHQRELADAWLAELRDTLDSSQRATLRHEIRQFNNRGQAVRFLSQFLR